MKFFKRFRKISYLLPVLFLSCLTFPLFGGDKILLALGYSPGITDYIRTDLEPATHTYKQIPLGFDFSAAYLFSQTMGVGLETYWGIVDKMIIKNGSNRYVSDNWIGTLSDLYLSPQFVYIPFQFESGTLQFGIGPSLSIDYYHSEYGNEFSAFYYGFSLNTRYNYFIRDYFFLSAGFRFTLDIYGAWDSETFTDFIQCQYFPILGIGMKF